MSAALIAQNIFFGLSKSPVVPPVLVLGGGLLVYHYDLHVAAWTFCTGPGWVVRVLLLISLLFNWKSLPLVWTYRVLGSFWYQLIYRSDIVSTPRSLFKPVITSTSAPLMEIDYNLHKSNSTYFADADVARGHLLCYIFRNAWDSASNNAKSKLVLDPKSGEPIKGSLIVVLGSVQCTFRKEVRPYQRLEVWTYLLAWDRKWVYTVTYFVKKGTARPTEWLDPRRVKDKTGKPFEATDGWERNILATSVAKYVFKLGRFTVHPAVLLKAGGMLPERPDGWTSGPDQTGEEVDLSDIDLSEEGEWDWRRIEARRRKGFVYGSQLTALDEAKELFDGGRHGALGRYSPG